MRIASVEILLCSGLAPLHIPAPNWFGLGLAALEIAQLVFFPTKKGDPQFPQSHNHDENNGIAPITHP